MSNPPSGPPPAGTPSSEGPPYDAGPRRSQRRPLVFVLVLVLALVVLLGLAVLLGVRALRGDRDGTAGGGSGPTSSEPSPTPTAKTVRGVVGFSVVQDSRPEPPEGCPNEAAWKDLDGACLRLGGGSVAVVTARSTVRSGRPVVALTLRPPGDQTLADLTERHVGGQLAIVVGDRVVSAPVVNGPISGGRMEITGDFTREDTERLVDEIGS